MATDTSTATRWHTVVPTVLGRLSLVRDTDALLGLYYPHHWYMPNPATFGPRCDEGFEDAFWQLNEYFAGLRSRFGLPLAPRGDEFQHCVWNLVQQVPYGHTTTYGDLAGRLGVDVTAQHVGAAIGRNPLCIFIPCHRVVGRTGKLTGYAGGIERKRHLLDLEQSNLARTLNDDSEGSDNMSLLTTKKANGHSNGEDGALRVNHTATFVKMERSHLSMTSGSHHRRSSCRRKKTTRPS